jgi:hypothetical protein
MLCTPPKGTRAEERLARDYFDMYRFEWPDDESVNFHLPPGDLIRLLRRSGLTVEDLIEVRAPEGGSTRHIDIAMLDWAHRWPTEEIWKARKSS